MIKVGPAIIVEGKYDKIKLSSIFDALIIEVNGFHIFKDKEKIELIKALAKTQGILILTDSDNAGKMIRNHINNIVKEGKIYQVFMPEIYGKEKRKEKASAEGLLGVEGIDKSIIIEAFKRSGALLENVNDENVYKITNLDLYNLGLSGGENSAFLRGELLRKLSLPTNLSKNNMLKILSQYTTLEDLKSIITEIKEEF